MLLSFVGSISRLRGAMVARLTPNQKAACSNHVGVSADLFMPFYGGFTLSIIYIIRK